ncbi:MAG: Fic family protein [Bdellovibrionales bacterium]|nr:Fic family protein [Bdellovibrionales bacterium]
MSLSHLQKQREEQRLQHAIEYVRESTNSIKNLTSSELARLNQILTARTDSTWRNEPVLIKIPTGKSHSLSIVSDPVDSARKIIGLAFEMAHNQSVGEAAVYLYVNLVKDHLFQDANRRTAALAVQWLLGSNEIDFDPNDLLNSPLGDVREEAAAKSVEAEILNLIKDKT